VFSNTSIAINPGVLASFPYLAPIASNFEEYKIRGLVFEFVSTTSPYLAGGAMGSVVLSMQYNPTAPIFTSKVQMENSDFAISARPDQSMVYGVECAMNMQNMYLVRQGTSPAPLTATDLGIMQFAIQSPIAANTVVGEVWVSYDIELMRPKAQTAGAGWYHNSASGGAVGTFPTFGTVQSQIGCLSGVVQSTSVAGSTNFTLPSLPSGTAVYVNVVARYNGATAAGANITVNATNSVQATSLGNGIVQDAASFAAGNGVGTSVLTTVLIVGGQSVVSLVLPAAPAGTTSSTFDFMVNIVGYGLTVATI